jgi:6-methylsalicylate decarboxylase
MIVDIHAHYFPPEYLRFIDQAGWPPRHVAKLHELSVTERIELMDRGNVDVQVLSNSSMQPYFPDVRRAKAGARMCNDLYAECCAAHYGRFAAFAALPLPHVDSSLAEISRCLDELGMVGVNLGCSIAGRQVDDPLFDPVFAELDRRGATAFFHPTGELTGGGLGSDYGLDWLIGATFEDTVTALRLTLSGLTGRYPNVNYVLAHFGGSVPFILARLHRRSPDLVAALGRLYYDTVSNTTSALSCACAAFGPAQLLYGTDFPYGDEELFHRCLSYLDEAGLDAEAVRGIRGDTAARLLGLDRSRELAVGAAEETQG